jgi:hypothetical protein
MIRRKPEHGPFDSASSEIREDSLDPQDDWLEDTETSVVLINEDGDERKLADLRKSLELQLASLTIPQLKKRLVGVEAKLKSLVQERDLRIKVSGGEDKADITKVNEKLLPLGVEEGVIHKLIASKKNAQRIASIEDVVVPVIKAEPDEEEAREIEKNEKEERSLESAIEKARSASIDAIARAGGISDRVKNELPPRVQSALTKEQHNFPNVNLEQMARDAYSGRALPPSKTFKESEYYYDDASARTDNAVAMDLDEITDTGKREQMASNIEFLKQAEKSRIRRSVEEHVRTDGTYDVKSARIQSESGWSRFKRGLSELFATRSPKIERIAPPTQKEKPTATPRKETATWENETTPSTTRIESADDVRAATQMRRTLETQGAVNARRPEVVKPEKRGFFARLFGGTVKESPGAKYTESLKKHDRVPTYTKTTTQEDVKKFQERRKEPTKEEAKKAA